MTTTIPLPPPAPRHDPSLPPPVGLVATLGSLADADLIALAAEGDTEAFSILYRRHASRLLAVAWRVLGNRHDAEEALQESFLFAWRKAGDYQASRASVSAWLALITRCRSLDRLRSQQSNRKWQEEYDREEATAVEPPAGPATQVQDRERSDRVLAALQQLPAEQRRVLELCYYRGLSQQEVAEHSGVPLGTVKSRTSLAMKKLRRELADEIGQLI